MTTSAPWLKIAPNWVGQWRRHASQLMHSDISIRSGGFFHFGLRSCALDALEPGRPGHASKLTADAGRGSPYGAHAA